MKKMRRLIPAIAMLLVSAVMLSTASFAWFTISTSAKATGMTVSAMASSSLLIVNGTDAEAGDPDASFMTSNGIAQFSTAGANMNPATRESNQNVGSSSGLVYITNTDVAIDPNNGNVKADATATWAPAVNGSSTYYIDYVVYLGTAGGDFSEKTLNAYVTVDKNAMAALHNAIAVDFLLGDQDTATDTNGNYILDDFAEEGETGLQYAGTTWLSVAANNTNGAKVELGEGSLVPEAVSTTDTTTEDDEGNDVTTTITEATGDYLVVVMRIYFDGAHQMGNDGAYVRDVNTTEKTCGFNVTLKVE